MIPHPIRTLLLCALVCIIAVPASSQQVAKRPIKHDDYASWRSIGSPALSPDGTLVAYALDPQDGDGEFVLRNLTTGKEFRQPRGSRSGPTFGSRGRSVGLPTGATIFSPDGKFVVFRVYPPKPDRTKGKVTASKTSGIGVMESASGKVNKIERVRSYQMPEEGATWLAYLRTSIPAKTDNTKGKTKTLPKTPTPTSGELVLRNLANGKERSFPDVSEYTLAKDGHCLVFAVASSKPESNGVYAITPGQTSAPLALRSGSGRYSRLTWDEKQRQIAFYHTITQKAAKPGDPAPPSVVRVYRWQRPATGTVTAPPPIPAGTNALAGFTLVALQATTPTPASALTPGDKAFAKGHAISDQASLSFSPDGQRVYFSVAAPPPPRVASQGKAVVELWHYNDDFIQPMQKVRHSSASKTYRAVYHLADGSCRQLAHEEMATVIPAISGDWAVGVDDRPYRRLVGSETAGMPTDLYLVNQKTGAKKLLLKKSSSTTALSPAGKHLLAFDGKNWIVRRLADGKAFNLTKSLKIRFDDELHDTPNAAPPYGFAGWTKDDKHVLVYDRFDIWQITPDGSSAKNLTSGMGRKNSLRLRVVRLDRDERAFDPAKPLLLRAENEKTRDTGFYRVAFDGEAPKMLIMGARNYSTPIKAKKGDRLLLTVSTFYDYPDLYSADMDFREVKRISNANPQKAKYIWGKAELIRYKNSDGVPLQGMLIKPENFNPNKKYPMIVYIYERLSQNLHSFRSPAPGTSINPTYYASNGYLVLMPDICYTTGHPGQSAVKCVLPAVQAVVDKGYVNEKAIGIQGHSWGGYQTAYLVTQTTRFAAASAGAPVSNMTSAYGGIRWGTGLSRQFQYEKTQSRIGETLWQGHGKYVENSPLFHANRIKTPLIMLHNDRDEAVPWYQGIEFYMALRRLGKEAYLFNYTGEGHGLRQRVNQMDYTVRMQQFFDHHLKGAKKPTWMEKGIPYTPPPQPSGPTPGRTRTRG